MDGGLILELWRLTPEPLMLSLGLERLTLEQIMLNLEV
jgi:hypothetical protein